MRTLPHAGNECAYLRAAENKTQGHFRQRHPGRHQFFQSVSALDAGNQILWSEINISPVAFGPFAVFGELAGQSAFVERHPRDYRHVHFGAGGKQFVLGILIEYVVNHLHRIDQSTAHRAHSIPRLPAIDADADRREQILGSELVHLFHPAIVFDPAVFPDMKLQEIETFEAGMLETFVHALFDVLRRKGIVEREVAAAGPR